MNRWQKIARFNLIVMTISLLLSGSAVLITATKIGFPRAYGGLGFLGICGIMGITPFLYKKKQKDKVDLDERDHIIQKKAALGGFTAFFLYSVVVCMTTWGIVGAQGSIPVKTLPLMLVSGFLVSEFVRSIAILILYSRS